MGGGCSMHNKRVADAVAEKAKDQTTKLEEIGDAGINTPATVVNEQQAAPERAQPQNEKQREFLEGMSPPSSPGGFARKDPPVAPASYNDPHLPIVSETVAPEMGKAQPTVLPAVELGNGDGVVPRADGSVGTAPLAAPSHGRRRTGGSGEWLEGGEGGGSAPAARRSVEQILQFEESQERLPAFSSHDPLPQIAPSPAASADFATLQRRGHTLDIGFREDPTSIVPTSDADSLFRGEGSAGGNGNTQGEGGRPVPGDQRSSVGGTGSVRHTNSGRQSHSNEVLTVTPLTPEDVGEEAMRDRRAPVKDRWPRNDGGRHSDGWGDEDGTPPRHEARPALAAGASEVALKKSNFSSFGGRGGLSVVDFTADGENELSVTSGGMNSSGDGGAWGATRGHSSLLDADEEDFMETLLMES